MIITLAIGSLSLQPLEAPAVHTPIERVEVTVRKVSGTDYRGEQFFVNDPGATVGLPADDVTVAARRDDAMELVGEVGDALALRADQLWGLGVLCAVGLVVVTVGVLDVELAVVVVGVVDEGDLQFASRRC